VPWRFLDTGFHSGDYNMALDAAVVKGGFCEAPTLRVFRWRPFCVSLGYHQNVEDVNLEKCSLLGFDVVRRPTAGRAILHAQELTYSVMIPARHAWYELLPLDLYGKISEAIVSGLQSLGARVQFAPGDKLYRDGKPLRVSCFASAARNEVVHNGRKVAGSAQRRFREGTLQHGSILLNGGHEQLIDVLNGDPSIIRAEHRRLLEHTATLARICHRGVTYAEVAQALRRGFSEVLGVEFENGHPYREEIRLARSWRETYRILKINQLEERLCESLAS